MGYRFNKPDANQESIIAALRQIGCTVHVVNRAPFDIVVGRNGKTYILELKDGRKPPSAQALKPSQEKFKREWLGQWDCVNCINDAIRVVTGQ